jgi:hypothetical protein
VERAARGLGRGARGGRGGGRRGGARGSFARCALPFAKAAPGWGLRGGSGARRLRWSRSCGAEEAASGEKMGSLETGGEKMGATLEGRLHGSSRAPRGLRRPASSDRATSMAARELCVGRLHGRRGALRGREGSQGEVGGSRRKRRGQAATPAAGAGGDEGRHGVGRPVRGGGRRGSGCEWIRKGNWSPRAIDRTA